MYMYVYLQLTTNKTSKIKVIKTIDKPDVL